MENPKPDWAMNKREKVRAAQIEAGETPKRRKWPWLVALLVVAVGAGGLYYANEQGLLPTPPEPTAEVEPAAPREIVVQLAPYEVETLAPRVVQESLAITGSLTPTHQVALSAEVSARLLEVNVRAGDAVTKGQVLAKFDVDSLQNQLEQADANAKATRIQYRQAETDYERTKTLVEKGLAAPNALEGALSAQEQLRASLEAQKTTVANAEAALEKATVLAPYDGVISSRSVDPGAFVGAGSPMFTIVDLTSLEVEATAPVAISSQLAVGQTVELTVEGFGDRVFEGEVGRIAPVVISGSRMLPVYVTLENNDGLLRGGMFAKGRIVLEENTDVLAVPDTALREDAQGDYVLVVAGDKVERRGIEIARDWEGGARVEIASGLAAGDVYVSEQLTSLRPGQTVALLEK